MDTSNCLPVSAEALGFGASALDIPPEPDFHSYLLDEVAPSLTAEDREKLFTGLIRQDSLVSVQRIGRKLAALALEETTPTAQRLNINEQLIKLAGLDRKKDDSAAQNGAGYQLVINIGDTTTKISAPIDVKAEEVTDASV